MTNRDPDLRSPGVRRREVLRAIANLGESHNLPMPMHLDPRPETGVSLRLDNNDRDGVRRWAECLGLGEIQESRIKGGKAYRTFDSVKAQKHQRDGLDFLDAYSFDVWSACDVTDGGEQS